MSTDGGGAGTTAAVAVLREKEVRHSTDGVTRSTTITTLHLRLIIRKDTTDCTICNFLFYCL